MTTLGCRPARKTTHSGTIQAESNLVDFIGNQYHIPYSLLPPPSGTSCMAVTVTMGDSSSPGSPQS